MGFGGSIRGIRGQQCGLGRGRSGGVDACMAVHVGNYIDMKKELQYPLRQYREFNVRVVLKL